MNKDMATTLAKQMINIFDKTPKEKLQRTSLCINEKGDLTILLTEDGPNDPAHNFKVMGATVTFRIDYTGKYWGACFIIEMAYNFRNQTQAMTFDFRYSPRECINMDSVVPRKEYIVDWILHAFSVYKPLMKKGYVSRPNHHQYKLL